METMTKMESLKDQQEGGGDVSKLDSFSPFTSHTANLEAGQTNFTLRVLKMNGSTMLFLNAKDMEILDELAVAMPSRNPGQSQAVSSTIIGGHGQTDSSVLAAKLSRRYNRQFYVSLNLKLDRLVGPLFEKALITYINDHLEKFA
ncbi:uncharacterized protein Dwil_GK20768 [Drosophila willistoni]|uniref:Proteasome assembly chaperone 3 n=1 Tax=Drosophila willistoni TaxID=7260 RepID=B4MJQ6_DROWI|nr:uncharacterized protein LOC6638190 [Drosophila willistoni]EDW72345.2 uncharacterized protein Dwil_GK20768 [Drosophila willistoni]